MCNINSYFMTQSCVNILKSYEDHKAWENIKGFNVVSHYKIHESFFVLLIFNSSVHGSFIIFRIT